MTPPQLLAYAQGHLLSAAVGAPSFHLAPHEAVPTEVLHPQVDQGKLLDDQVQKASFSELMNIIKEKGSWGGGGE